MNLKTLQLWKTDTYAAGRYRDRNQKYTLGFFDGIDMKCISGTLCHACTLGM
jgi:hypothetical protein